MTERDYSELNPKELQAEFKAILGQAPFSIWGNKDEGFVSNTLSRRVRSEHRDKLLARAENLLKFSQTT